MYPFPRLSVCIWDGQGCDANFGKDACIATAYATVYDSCYEIIEIVHIEREVSPSIVSNNFSDRCNCVRTIS